MPIIFTSVKAVEEFVGYDLPVVEKEIEGYVAPIKLIYKEEMYGKKNAQGNVQVPFGRGHLKILPHGWSAKKIRKGGYHKRTHYIGKISFLSFFSCIIIFDILHVLLFNMYYYYMYYYI